MKNMTKKELNNLLEKALIIAASAHRGQRDKGGEPYIFHPIRVASKCKTIEEKIVALLHDTIEDTNVTADLLRKEGFPEFIIEAIYSVTKRAGENYIDFVKRGSQNSIGRVVKKCDLEDNMNLCRLDSIEDKDFDRLKKYVEAYGYLTAENK